MTGAWRGGLQLSNPVSYAVVNPIASGSTFTKGAWLQVTASTTSDSTWIQIVIREASLTTAAAVGIDIGFGAAASEVVAINNLICSSVGRRMSAYYLPLNIIAGTRLAVRCASSTASDSAGSVQLSTFADAFMSAGTNSAVDTYGFLTATNLGAFVEPGTTANTKGVYTQITASTTNDLAGFCLGFDNQTDSTSGTVGLEYWLLDIAVGAAASEQVLVPNLLVVCRSNNSNAFIVNTTTPYMPIQIPAGTRISARAQCSTNTSPDRKIGVSFYGVRL